MSASLTESKFREPPFVIQNCNANCERPSAAVRLPNLAESICLDPCTWYGGTHVRTSAEPLCSELPPEPPADELPPLPPTGELPPLPATAAPPEPPAEVDGIPPEEPDEPACEPALPPALVVLPAPPLGLPPLPALPPSATLLAV